MDICLERGADLHMAQRIPLPLTVSCFSKIQIGLPFRYRRTWVVLEKGPLNECVCVCVTGFKQLLQMNDFATFDMLPFTPLHWSPSKVCILYTIAYYTPDFTVHHRSTVLMVQ